MHKLRQKITKKFANNHRKGANFIKKITGKSTNFIKRLLKSMNFVERLQKTNF